jgi:hypothetical protein
MSRNIERAQASANPKSGKAFCQVRAGVARVTPLLNIIDIRAAFKAESALNFTKI